MLIIFRIISIPFFLLAFLKWITYNPDCNPFLIGGCGLLDIGISGTIAMVINWVIIVVLLVIGVWLWDKGKIKS